MRRSRFTDAQKAAILAEQGDGGTTSEVCRRHGISPATFYNWKLALRDRTDMARTTESGRNIEHSQEQEIEVRIRMRILEEENARLKRLLADAMLENLALKNR